MIFFIFLHYSANDFFLLQYGTNDFFFLNEINHMPHSIIAVTISPPKKLFVGNKNKKILFFIF